MNIERDTIDWVADLARLNLSEEEKIEMERTLASIIGYMDILGELELESVQPTSHVLGYTNITRPDRPKPSLSVQEVRKLAPRWERGHVVVPRIV